MKRMFLGTVSVGTLSLLVAGLMAGAPRPAMAGEATDQEYKDSYEALKKEMARLREENAALRERQRLQTENAVLRVPPPGPQNAALAAPSHPSSAPTSVQSAPSGVAQAAQPVARQPQPGRIPQVVQSQPD